MARLERLEGRDNTRYPAHINFSKDIICFPAALEWLKFWRDLKLERRSAMPRAFLSSMELNYVTRVELYIDVVYEHKSARYGLKGFQVMQDSVRRFFRAVHIFPKARSIFVGVFVTGVEGDIVGLYDPAPYFQPLPRPRVQFLVSDRIQEARDIGKQALEASKMQHENDVKPLFLIERVYERPQRSEEDEPFKRKPWIRRKISGL